MSFLDFNLESFIKTIGLFGVFGIVYAESGLLIGFFFPGDSLLFTAGFLASQGFLDIYLLIIGCFIAAVLGDNTGYAFGHRIGKRLFQRHDSVWFHKDNLLKAQEFYKKHGRKTIILARFIPIIRTFAPFVAGIGKMSYTKFISYNIFGGLLWVSLFLFSGYFFGALPIIKENFHLAIMGIIFVSLLPIAVEYIKHLQDKRKKVELSLD